MNIYIEYKFLNEYFIQERSQTNKYIISLIICFYVSMKNEILRYSLVYIWFFFNSLGL